MADEAYDRLKRCIRTREVGIRMIRVRSGHRPDGPSPPRRPDKVFDRGHHPRPAPQHRGLRKMSLVPRIRAGAHRRLLRVPALRRPAPPGHRGPHHRHPVADVGDGVPVLARHLDRLRRTVRLIWAGRACGPGTATCCGPTDSAQSRMTDRTGMYSLSRSARPAGRRTEDGGRRDNVTLVVIEVRLTG